MKKTIITAVVLAAISAPVFAGGLDAAVEAAPIMAPEEIAGSSAGSLGSASAGGILPALLVLGLLAAAASGSN